MFVFEKFLSPGAFPLHNIGSAQFDSTRSRTAMVGCLSTAHCHTSKKEQGNLLNIEKDFEHITCLLKEVILNGISAIIRMKVTERSSDPSSSFQQLGSQIEAT